MTQQQIPFEQAESIVKHNDKVRIAFVEEFYRVPWESIHAFDLVIDTGKIPADMAATWVIAAAKSFAPSAEIDKPTVATIKVDRILAEAVSEILKSPEAHR